MPTEIVTVPPTTYKLSRQWGCRIRRLTRSSRRCWWVKVLHFISYILHTFFYDFVTFAGPCAWWPLKYWKLNCLFNRLFRLTTKNHQIFVSLAPCEVIHQVDFLTRGQWYDLTSGFHSQRTSNADGISISWCRQVWHECCYDFLIFMGWRYLCYQYVLLCSSFATFITICET